MKNNWQTKKLEDVVQILDNKRIPINNAERERRINGRSEDSLYPYYGATGQVGSIDDFIFNGEYVLLGEDGAPFLDPNKSKAYIVKGKFWVNNHAHVLNGIEVNNTFLKYYLDQFDFRDFVTGTTRLKLNQTRMKAIPIPTPNINTQESIAQKLDSLFSKIDAGEKGLQQVQQQLEVYRQAVLKKAFDNNNWPRKLIKDIAEDVRYGSSKKTNEDSHGIPVLRMGNYDSFGNTDFAKLKYLPKNHDEFPELLLKDGDMLFNRTNSSELVGKTMVWKDNMLPEASFASYLIRVQFRDGYLPEFYSAYINSLYGRQWIKNVVNQQVGQANVNGTKLKNLEVPIPPHDIQKQVVEEIKKQYSIIDNLSTAITGSKLTSGALRQSILKKAFNGELI